MQRNYGFETQVHEHTYSVSRRRFASAETALEAGIKAYPGKHIRVRYLPKEHSLAAEHRPNTVVVESAVKPVGLRFY